MRRDHRSFRSAGVVGWLRDAAVLSFVSVLLSGCVFVASEPGPPPVADPEPAAAEPAPPPPPGPPPPAPPPAPEHWAILLSNDIPALREIADEIVARLGSEDVTVHSLEGRQSNAERVVAELANEEPDRLIAVGLLAATVARRIPETPIVFCQVYNYGDHGLVSPYAKGVNFLPPFELQLDAWKDLSPDLSRVGVITGPGQEPLIEEILAATASHGVELSVRTATTDQEALYNFKTLTPDIQGLWLLPDNRILSPEVVREIMSYAAKHRRQVVVFGSNLLRLGALMSVESHHPDVADRVLARFDSVRANGELGGPDMLALTEVRLQVNHEVADHLGLIVPEQVADSGTDR